MAISCRNYQLRTNLQPEIATTSVRTGLAMTRGVAFSCHCEERSDVAISCRNYQLCTNLQPEIATTGVRTGLIMARGVASWEYCGLVNRESLFLREDAVKGAGEFCFCAAAEGGAVSIVSGE